MISTQVSHCDCCGLSIAPQAGDACPRCGYPVTTPKEERFLESSVHDLQRVVTYGGANMTVAQLMQYYRTRLLLLQQLKQAPAPIVEKAKAVEAPAPVALPVAPPMLTQATEEQQAPVHVFSLKSFFADQTITIVAALGAFLILIGSLSFVASTANLLLSFLTMFGVHAVFGVTGVVAYRFRSFRLVAVIYTAIFALLVPLVGFSGYRLVSGNLIALSPPTLVAIAATYAAIVYGALAIYQRFSPFGYLSVVSLVLADLAVAYAFHLGGWWWPAGLMLLALPALTSQTHSPATTALFTGEWAVLRDPVRLLMWACVLVCTLGIIGVFLYSANSDIIGQSSSEMRFSIVSMTLLLLCWSMLFVWRTRRMQWAALVPYLFLLAVLASCYDLELGPLGYVLTLTAAALFLHGLTRVAASHLQSYGKLVLHMEGLALVLVGVVPFIAAPRLPLQILEQAFTTYVNFLPMGEASAEIIAMVAGLGLTISVMLAHTGLRSIPDAAQSRWRWLLLLSAFLLNYASSMLMLTLKADPVWCFLGITLMLVAGSVLVRRQVSAAWANPLDVIVLGWIAETLLLGLLHSTTPDFIISLLLFFAVLSYCIVLYQRRARGLFLPLILALLAFAPLLQRPRVLLAISVLLPLVAVIVHRFITERWRAEQTEDAAQPRAPFALAWEWPLLVIALCSGFIISWHDIVSPASTVEQWFPVVFPVALEMTTIALVWYASAALARVKWWVLVAAGFAAAALLMPDNSFWVLAWLAPLLAVAGFAIKRLAGRDWTMPLFVAAILAEVMAGIAAHNQGQVPAATGALLLFAALIYLVGVVENEPVWLWVAPFFAIWSVYYSAQVGDLYRSPIVALAGAAIGVGIGRLKFAGPRFSQQEKKLWRLALPLYTTAIAAAVLTGVYGTLAGINKPFPTAIPDALFVYALVAYGVSLLERRSVGQWLVAGFAIWATLLMPQISSCYVYTGCSGPVQSMFYSLVAIALATAMLGLLVGGLTRTATDHLSPLGAVRARFAWSWSWYCTSLVAIVLAVGWSYSVEGMLARNVVLAMLAALLLLTLLIMLVERAPELLIVPVALAAWIIPQTQWTFWQQMVAYNLLCMLIFASQFVWRFVPPATRLLPASRLHTLLGLGGQALVVLTIVVQGGLSADAGLLAHVGAGSLGILAALLFWHGSLQTKETLERWWFYSAGLLLSLVVTWELVALRYTHIDWLTLAPATYLVVVAPFLSRDTTLPYQHRIGQLCSISGAALLLLPTLWLSFNGDNLQPTLYLAAESLALLLMGITTRVRVFILSGAALVVVSAMHALFLPSLGIPPSLALAILGGTLLAIATALSLARHRLQLAWTRWR